MRRDVRAGRRSTVGNRVGRVFVLEGSNPSLSATLAGKTGQTAVQGSVELLISQMRYESEFSASSGRKYV